MGHRAIAIVLAAVTLSASSSVAHGQAHSILRGRVLTDSTEVPIAGAEVTLKGLGLVARSDSAGYFFIAAVPSGMRRLAVRRLGFAVFETDLSFAPGAMLEADILLTPQGTLLPQTVVEANATRPGKLADFDRRRAAGFGRFLTGSELEKMSNRRLSAILRSLPGLQIIDSRAGGAAWVATGRGAQSIERTKAPGSSRLLGAPDGVCWAAVVLDGVVVYGGAGKALFDINSVSPGDIAGIEFYSGPATVPPEYNGTRNTCGLLLIWTK